MTTVLLAIGFFAIFFLLMSVRLIFLKDGKFRGTCASQKVDGGSCAVCGTDVKPGESCNKSRTKSAIEKLLFKF